MHIHGDDELISINSSNKSLWIECSMQQNLFISGVG